MPVAPDLREPPVGLLQGEVGLGVAELVHEPVHGRQPGVVGAASAYRPRRRHRVVHQRGLVRDRQQCEGDVRLAAVQAVGPADREHRRLHVLRALAARQQQLTDTQRQVEHARDGRALVLLRLRHPLRRRPLGHRHAQHRAHPVLPGQVLGQTDPRNAGGGGERRRCVLDAVDARRAERRPLRLLDRCLRYAEPLGKGELGGGLRLAVPHLHAGGWREGHPRLVRLRFAVLHVRHVRSAPRTTPPAALSMRTDTRTGRTRRACDPFGMSESRGSLSGRPAP